MEYSVRVWSAIQGDVVPLRYVAEAMARCAASGYGTLSIHGPTLKNLRGERMLLLLDAVRNGQLTVCDYQGRFASAMELVEKAKALADELDGAVSVEAMNAEAIIPFLHARRRHLVEWGKASGDIFLFVETPGTVVDSDLRNFSEAGFGKTIEAGYFRSAVGGGESEPWRDNLHSKAPVSTTPAQSPAPPTPVVAVGASSVIHSTKARRDALTPVIERAQSECRNPQDAAEVWGVLLMLAEKKTAPLIGATEEGLQYLKGGAAEIFTRKSLGKRLAR